MRKGWEKKMAGIYYHKWGSVWRNCDEWDLSTLRQIDQTIFKTLKEAMIALEKTTRYRNRSELEKTSYRRSFLRAVGKMEGKPMNRKGWEKNEPGWYTHKNGSVCHETTYWSSHPADEFSEKYTPDRHPNMKQAMERIEGLKK